MNTMNSRWMVLAVMLGAAALRAAAPAAAQAYEPGEGSAVSTYGTYDSAYNAEYAYTPAYFGQPVIVAQGHGRAGRPPSHEGGGPREPRYVPPPPPPPRYVQPARGRGGQMTEEERQQFRRDLDKANRELYAPRR